MRWVRIAAAFLFALGVAVAGAAVAHTQLVLAALSALGVEIGLIDRLRSTFVAVRGFVPTLGPVLAAGLALAFLVATGLKRLLPPLSPAAYPLAGAAAMATAIVLMNLQYETTPIASTRTPLGFAALCATTAFAGWMFGRLAAVKPTAARRPSRL